LNDPGAALERKEPASAISVFIRTLPSVEQETFLLRDYLVAYFHRLEENTNST